MLLIAFILFILNTPLVFNLCFISLKSFVNILNKKEILLKFFNIFLLNYLNKKVFKDFYKILLM